MAIFCSTKKDLNKIKFTAPIIKTKNKLPYCQNISNIEFSLLASISVHFEIVIFWGVNFNIFAFEIEREKNSMLSVTKAWNKC